MAPLTPDPLLCDRCGKPIEDRESAIEVATISFSDGEQTSTWSHERCFPQVSVAEFTGRIRP